MDKKLIRDSAEIIAAFLVAWIAYQLLIVGTGTPLPIVSVVSESMYHTEGFDEWWSHSSFYPDNEMTKEQFLNYQNFNGLAVGDLLFVTAPEDLKIGDIIIYEKYDQQYKKMITVVHRIVEINEQGYVTKGDNHNTNSRVDSGIRSDEDIVGKVRFAFPLLGYPRLLLFAVGI